MTKEKQDKINKLRKEIRDKLIMFDSMGHEAQADKMQAKLDTINEVLDILEI